MSTKRDTIITVTGTPWRTRQPGLGIPFLTLGLGLGNFSETRMWITIEDWREANSALEGLEACVNGLQSLRENFANDSEFLALCQAARLRISFGNGRDQYKFKAFKSEGGYYSFSLDVNRQGLDSALDAVGDLINL